jgi:hypothetical protein
MSAGDDKPADKPPPGPPGALGPPGLRGKPPSRDGVRYDQRGNAVWQWAVDTGKHAIDSTSRLLKRLEVPGLSIEDDAKPGTKPGAKPDKPGGAGSSARPSRGPPGPPPRTSGHDPYGRRTDRPNPLAPPPPPPPAARAPGTTIRKPMTASPPRRSWWQRLFRRR